MMNNPDQQRHPSYILYLTTLVSFMTAFMGSSLNVALPIIGNDFHASATSLSWLSTIYLLTTASLLIPIGKLSDIKGRNNIFKYGLIIFTTGSLLCGISQDTFQLMFFRSIQGIGSSFLFATSTAILISAFPQNQRGKVLGINTASVYTGLSSGPFLGGLITQSISWRMIFYLNFFIGLFLIIVTFIILIEKETTNESYDLKGSIFYSISIILMMIGLTFLPKFIGIVLLITGSALLITFYKIEKVASHPVLNVNVFKSNKTFVFSNLAALINYCATFAISFLLSFYLQIVKGLNPRDAGIILITQPVMQAFFSPLAGKLSDKVEPQIVASIGMGLLTVGLVILCFLNPLTQFYFIIINLFLLGIGFALFSSPNVNAIMSSVDRKYYGVASSTTASMRVIGQTFSMGVVTMIFRMFIGDSKITANNQLDFLISLRIAFIIFSVLSFTGIFFSISRGSIHKKID